jgi:hypothetical protein
MLPHPLFDIYVSRGTSTHVRGGDLNVSRGTWAGNSNVHSNEDTLG